MTIADTPDSIRPFNPALGILASSYRRGTRLGTHMHAEAQLLFATSGVMQVTTPKGRWLVPPERAVWLPPRLEHAVDMLADIEMRALLFESGWLRRHPEAPRLAREFVVRVEPLLREIILALFRAKGDAERERALAETAIFELAEAEDGATFMPLPTDPRARRVAELLLAEPARPHRIEDLAHAVGTSPRTLTRLFSAETELSFKEWRQRARIMAAIELLDRPAVSIKQVARRLGFASVAAFSHAFRQITGTTPSAFGRRSIAGDRLSDKRTRA